jgi:methylthioribose-1-phosphate isomerase
VGRDDGGQMRRVRLAPEGAKARNPAFDVTPAELIAGLITERGIIKPGEAAIREAFGGG